MFAVILALLVYGSAEYRAYLLDKRITYLETYADQNTKVQHKVTSVLSSLFDLIGDNNCKCKR